MALDAPPCEDLCSGVVVDCDDILLVSSAYPSASIPYAAGGPSSEEAVAPCNDVADDDGDEDASKGDPSAAGHED
jgi:hypothetical protein